MFVNFGKGDLHTMPLRTNEFQAQEVISGTSPSMRPNYCPLLGHNPGSLMAFLPDITP